MRPQGTTSAVHQSQQKPARAILTDRLLYAWEHLRPSQRDAAWEMVENMRATMAAERRSRAVISLLVVMAGLAAAVLVYLVMWAPAP
jgi:hypothetical protein